MKKILTITLFAIFLLWGCDDNTSPQPGIELNGFENEAIAKVFQNCATCHGDDLPPNGLSITSYASLKKGSSTRSYNGEANIGGEAFIAFNPEKSLLYQMLSRNTENPVHDFSEITDNDKNEIYNWIASGAKNSAKEIPFNNSGGRIFVCNQSGDNISVIDPENNLVSRLIDVDFSDGIPDAPHMVKTHNGFLYVTLIKAGKLLKYNLSNLELVGEVNNLELAGMIQIMPEGNKAYISHSSTSPSIFNSVYVVDIENMVLQSEVELPLTGVPHGMSLSANGKKLYVAELTKNALYIIDTDNDEIETTIVFDELYEPMQTMISPDGKFLYLSARKTGQLLVFDTSSNEIISSVEVGASPMQIVVNSTGNKIYVNSMMMSSVYVVSYDGQTWTNTNIITHPAFNMLHGIDISTDDKTLYVSSRNNDGKYTSKFKVKGEGNLGTVGIIDLATETVTKVIETEESASGITVER